MLEARRALTDLVSGQHADVDVARAALLIAAEEYPDLRPELYLRRLKHLGEQLRQRLAGEAVRERQIAVANELLFGEEGFRGNEGQYYDPRNSYLNEVLDRRLGIPITLSIVYAAVAREAGLAVRGVGLPGHFIVSYGELLIDPFNCGKVLSQENLQALLRQNFGNSVQLTKEHLQPTPARAILTRLITNLKGAYIRQGDLRRAVRAAEQLEVVAPRQEANRRELSGLRQLYERRN